MNGEPLNKRRKTTKIPAKQPILMPKNVPSELIFDIFTFLKRVGELEKCKTVNKAWKNCIEQNSKFLPFYEFNSFVIKKEQSNIVAIMELLSYKTDYLKKFIPITYSPNDEEPWKLNNHVLKIIENSYFLDCIVYLDSIEHLWVFMEKFKNLAGKLNVLIFGNHWLLSPFDYEIKHRFCGKS